MSSEERQLLMGVAGAVMAILTHLRTRFPHEPWIQEAGDMVVNLGDWILWESETGAPN